MDVLSCNSQSRMIQLSIMWKCFENSILLYHQYFTFKEQLRLNCTWENKIAFYAKKVSFTRPPLALNAASSINICLSAHKRFAMGSSKKFTCGSLSRFQRSELTSKSTSVLLAMHKSVMCISPLQVPFTPGILNETIGHFRSSSNTQVSEMSFPEQHFKDSSSKCGQ
mmetsp:Transcript_21355/g.32556  ORF Transcript_21355/g.32556 Transcript_21355/m.32556 type:complete len:167 (+) Transcript_21355:426-926(+)